VQEVSGPVARSRANPRCSPSSGENPKRSKAAAGGARVPVPVRMFNPKPRMAQLSQSGRPRPCAAGRAGIIVIFTVFMLLKREDLRNRLLRLAGLSQLNLMTQRSTTPPAASAATILLQFLVNASFGALFGIGLYFMECRIQFSGACVAGILPDRALRRNNGCPGVLPIALSLAVLTVAQPLLGVPARSGSN